MASSSVVPENVVVSEAPSSGLPVVPLILAIVVAVFLSVAVLGGVAFYLVSSGRLGLPKAAAPVAAVSVAEAAHTMVLEPMVANLADAGGAAYLKMALTLKIADGPVKKGAPAKDEKPAKGMSDAEAAVRDTVLTVVGQQSAEQLLGPGGKERLKSALRLALAEHNPELKVMDLYFTDFLVQR